jgi:hypothetical protein
MVAIVAAVEGAAARRGDAHASLHAASWRFSAEAVKRGAADKPVLCFGDSMVKHGIHPRILQEFTGLPAYNFAIANGPPPTTYYLLRRAFERGARPALVVMDAEILADGPLSPTRPFPWSYLLTWRETVDLAASARSLDLFATVALHKLAPTLRDRPEIRVEILAALKGEAPPHAGQRPGFARNWALNLGAQANAKNRYIPELPDPPTGRVAGTWSPDPTNRLYLERTFDLAARRGVVVAWLLPPFHPHTQAHLRYRGEADLHVQFVRDLLARHPNVFAIDGRNAGYSSDVFFDACHLDLDGASALSAALASVLLRRAARPADLPRLASLPRYEPAPPTGDAVETLAASIAAVRAAGRRMGVRK